MVIIVEVASVLDAVLFPEATLGSDVVAVSDGIEKFPRREDQERPSYAVSAYAVDQVHDA